MNAPNRLAHATSPYLLQHAGNPVDWYPWSDEAIQRAQREDRPIFLSIGYSACHWCHVMAHESFEDPETARLLNDLFVNIKVDREERPDIDEIYMQAVQLFTGGHGGWPMSVFLTPGLEPYYGGTYFPPSDRHGTPGFRRIAQIAADAYRNKRDDIARTTQQVVAALQELTALQVGEQALGPDSLAALCDLLEASHDPVDGGFGGAPKFPHSMDVSFLLRYASRTGREAPKHMALFSLQKMARGGIYDQLGGGFHRYSTDARWLIPHFEKMLYDNALLARTYLEAYQLTGEAFYRDITRQTLDYVAREMTSPAGGFYSAQDADSEGVEGKFFVWTPSQLEAALGPEEARLACAYYNVTPAGNFEHGTSVLWVPRDDDVVAFELGMSVQALRESLARLKVALLGVREQRVRPSLDDKILVAWNGLMIGTFARAYQVLRQPDDLGRAVAAAECVLAHAGNGVFRTARQGRASGQGYLDDHASMIGAFLDLYEATFEARWFELAVAWNARLLELFDDGAGAFYYTSKVHEPLIARSRNFMDNATPSGNSLQVTNLLRLALFTGEERYRTRAEAALAAFARAMRQYPIAMPEMYNGLDLHLGPAVEVAIAGPDAAALLQETFASFCPRKVVAGWPDTGPAAALPLLQGRTAIGGRAAAYVCRGHACDAPVTRVADLRQSLGAANTAR